MKKHSYETLEQAAREIFLHDENQKALAYLSPTILIYFYHDGDVAGQRKVIEVFERFYSQYRGYLKSHFWDGMRRFARLNHTAFSKKTVKMLKEAERWESLAGCLTSDETGEYAGEYFIETLTAYPSAPQDRALSYLQLTLPLQLLKTAAGRKEFEEWVKYLCKQVTIYHGYAGLTVNLPYAYHRYQFHEYEITRRY